MTRIALSLLLLLLAAACGTAYHPLANGNGYAEEQLAPNVYRITYRGDTVLSPREAQQFALYRAAELSLAKGFQHFALVGRDVERVPATRAPRTLNGASAQSQSTSTPMSNPNAGQDQLYIPTEPSASARQPGTFRSKPAFATTATITIELREAKQPSDLDAADLVTRLRPIVNKRIVL